MKRLVMVLLLVAFFPAAFAISSCQVLESGSHTLTESISSKGTCLTLRGNVSLNLNGKTIDAENPLVVEQGIARVYGGSISGVVRVVEADLALEDISLSGSIEAENSSLTFIGKISSLEKPLAFTSSEANLTLNLSLAEGSLLHAKDSSLSLKNSLLSNFLSSSPIFVVENSSLALFDVALYNILADKKPTTFECRNSTLSLSTSTFSSLSLNGQLCNVVSVENVQSDDRPTFSGNSSLEGNYSIAIVGGTNTTIRGSYDYLKLKGARNASLEFVEIRSELLLEDSEGVSIRSAKFFPSGKLEAINSTAVVEESLFCSQIPYYVLDIGSNISFRKNYFRGISELYHEGLLGDVDEDFIADSGSLYPFGKELEEWLSDDYDPSPIIAKDDYCILSPIRGKATLAYSLGYSCEDKELEVNATFLNLPITFTLFATRTSPPYETYTTTAFSSATLTLNSTGLYKITLSSPGVLPSTTFFNAYECDEPQTKPAIEEVFVSLLTEARVGSNLSLKATVRGDGPAAFLDIYVKTPYGSEIKLTTDEEGFTSFSPISSGTYVLSSPVITLLGDVSFEVLQPKKTYSVSLPLNLSQASDVIISTKPVPVHFNITVENSTGIVVSTTSNASFAARLEPGEYNITVSSEERFSSISIYVPTEVGSKTLLTLNDIIALALMLAIITLPVLFINRPIYKASYAFNEGVAILDIKDFYNIPAAGVLVKVFRDGEKVAEGFTDDAGIFSFPLQGKGTYVAYADGRRVEGGKFRIR